MKNIFVLMLLFTLLTSCGQKQESSNAETSSITTSIEHSDISVEEFNARFSNPDPNTVILDVRTQEEYADGAIPNSVLIDFMSPDFKSEVSKLDPSKTYVVYCRTGRRSTAASKIMTKELSFEKVINLEGGYSDWSKNN